LVFFLITDGLFSYYSYTICRQFAVALQSESLVPKSEVRIVVYFTLCGTKLVSVLLIIRTFRKR